MVQLTTYSPDDVTLIVGDQQINGFKDGNFIEVWDDIQCCGITTHLCFTSPNIKFFRENIGKEFHITLKSGVNKSEDELGLNTYGMFVIDSVVMDFSTDSMFTTVHLVSEKGE